MARSTNRDLRRVQGWVEADFLGCNSCIASDSFFLMSFALDFFLPYPLDTMPQPPLRPAPQKPSPPTQRKARTMPRVPKLLLFALCCFAVTLLSPFRIQAEVAPVPVYCEKIEPEEPVEEGISEMDGGAEAVFPPELRPCTTECPRGYACVDGFCEDRSSCYVTGCAPNEKCVYDADTFPYCVPTCNGKICAARESCVDGRCILVQHGCIEACPEGKREPCQACRPPSFSETPGERICIQGAWSFCTPTTPCTTTECTAERWRICINGEIYQSPLQTYFVGPEGCGDPKRQNPLPTGTITPDAYKLKKTETCSATCKIEGKPTFEKASTLCDLSTPQNPNDTNVGCSCNLTSTSFSLPFALLSLLAFFSLRRYRKTSS